MRGGAGVAGREVADAADRPIDGSGRKRRPQSGTAIIPVDAGGETGVLARAFARVMDEVDAKTVALEREIVEHRRTEAAREHHAGRERLFSAAVESSNDAIITKSLDGLITGWNPAAERLYGYTAAEAVGQNIASDRAADRLTEVHDILRRIGWGETIEQNETVRLRKDGTRSRSRSAYRRSRRRQARSSGISKTARDITESNRTQRRCGSRSRSAAASSRPRRT